MDTVATAVVMVDVTDMDPVTVMDAATHVMEDGDAIHVADADMDGDVRPIKQ